MNKIKILAGQTAIYGLSSILGRVVNFLLVPLYTATFLPGEYGKVVVLYSYVAILNIIFTYGMETAFFRFSPKDKGNETFDHTATSVLVTSVLFSGVIYILAGIFSNSLGFAIEPYVIKWLAIIIFFDAIVAIPFARLRLQNKAVKFVIIRLIGILLTILFNIIFLVILPDIMADKYLGIIRPVIRQWYNPEMGIGYIFLANLIGSGTVLMLLRKEFYNLKFSFHWSKFKPLLIYAFPIMLTGLAGMLNENLDKILLPTLIPANFYGGNSPEAAVGVYGAAFKLSIFMMLAIQAFRYAVEPFFFSNADDKNAPELFAKVFYYFVILGVVIIAVVGFNIDLIGRLFLKRPEYWEALYLVPLLLTGKLLYGIYINLSVWYKIKDKTKYGTYFSFLGTAVTVCGNLLLVPVIGYAGSAVTMVLCFLAMCLASFYFGRIYFPVPYDLKTTGIYMLSTLFVVYTFRLFDFDNQTIGEVFAGIISVVFVVVVFIIERRKIN